MVEQAVLLRSARLDPVPASAGDARRLVRAALNEAGASDLLHLAELAVSELVTNAILHAATPVELSVEVTSTAVTVRVRDWHPRLPAQRHWDETATTGRGLSLVASVSDAFGVDPQEPSGKSVWFQLLRGGEPTVDAAAEWNVDELLGELASTIAKRVVLVGTPVRLWLAGQQHWEAVLRELYLFRQSHAESDEGDLVGAGRALVALSNAAGRAIAANDSLESVDVELSIAAEEQPGFSALQDALDSGIRLAAGGHLLIRPALPEIVALRDWACEQVLAQAHDVLPTPWA
ncbi:MAG: putative sensor protein, partial [Frankiales bacterium]|nr:putative sensor protein [Frankiales bacterium]